MHIAAERMFLIALFFFFFFGSFFTFKSCYLFHFRNVISLTSKLSSILVAIDSNLSVVLLHIICHQQTSKLSNAFGNHHVLIAMGYRLVSRWWIVRVGQCIGYQHIVMLSVARCYISMVSVAIMYWDYQLLPYVNAIGLPTCVNSYQ